jgi:RNA polymerase sigma factor (TIGR02999 family)
VRCGAGKDDCLIEHTANLAFYHPLRADWRLSWFDWMSILPWQRLAATLTANCVTGNYAMPGEITELLEAWKLGDAEAGEALVTRTYRELRRLAQAYLRHERRSHTLQATALLHEAYLRLLRRGPGTIENRDAFFRLMAAEMRRRLVDHARRRLADKRGGGIIHESLRDQAVPIGVHADSDIEAMLGRLDGALQQLTDSYPRTAHVVQLRFLAGLTTEETAHELGVSAGTVKREWTFARAWLAAAIESTE